MKRKGRKKRNKERKRGKSAAKWLIVSIDDGVPSPQAPHVKSHDHICWASADNRDYWVKFLNNTWPFKGTSSVIFVEANSPSSWHKVAKKVDPGQQLDHSYAIKFDPSDPDPPPDGPDIIVDG